MSIFILYVHRSSESIKTDVFENVRIHTRTPQEKTKTYRFTKVVNNELFMLKI